MENGRKEGSKELTFLQSEIRVVQLCQYRVQLTFGELFGLGCREEDAHQEQRNKGHHFGYLKDLNGITT